LSQPKNGFSKAAFCGISIAVKGKAMNKTLLRLLTLLLLAAGTFAEPQQPAKVPRIGFLSTSTPSAAASARADAFRQGLRDLGYVEGKNIFIEFRYAEGKYDRFPELAAELLAFKVDLIVAP
jgi:putative ABC transport system substrate-binding protein